MLLDCAGVHQLSACFLAVVILLLFVRCCQPVSVVQVSIALSSHNFVEHNLMYCIVSNYIGYSYC